MNGAKVYDRQTDITLGRAEIPWTTADAVIDFLEPLNCSVDCFQNDQGLMARKYYDHLEQYVTHPPSFDLVKHTRGPVDDLKEAVQTGGGSVQKFHAYFPDLALRPKVMEQLRREFPSWCSPSPCLPTWSSTPKMPPRDTVCLLCAAVWGSIPRRLRPSATAPMTSPC